MTLKINHWTLLVASLLVLFLFIIAFLINRTPYKSDKTCLALTTNHSFSESSSVDYTLLHKLKILDNGKGYDNLRGELTSAGKTYNIFRTVNFIFKKSSTSGLYQYRIVGTHTFTSDNIPDDILNRHITFLREGVERNVSLEYLGDNNILISDTGGPSLVCSLR